VLDVISALGKARLVALCLAGAALAVGCQLGELQGVEPLPYYTESPAVLPASRDATVEPLRDADLEASADSAADASDASDAGDADAGDASDAATDSDAAIDASDGAPEGG